MEEITALISSVGFPIGAYLLMWWMYNNTLKELTATLSQLTQTVTELKTYIEEDRTNG